MLRGVPLGLSFVRAFARTSVRALSCHALGVGILIGLAASAPGGTVLGAPGVWPPAVITPAALLACSSMPFTDVPINHEFCPEITWLKDKNITSGYGDGTYRPDNAATRMASAAFLARYAQATLSACSVPPFTDVAVSHPFCSEIKWMKDNAISTGYGDGTYRPGNSTTRMAASAFLARVAGATLSACSTPPFSDVPINHPFCPDITWIKDNAISNGNGDGTFGPTLAVTRGESAAWIYRVAVLVNDAPVVTTSAGSTAYIEGDPATVIDAGLTVTDSDDTDLESASVSITVNFETGDELGFSDQNGIAGSWSSVTGVLSLTGTASIASYQTALRSVTFATTNDDPATSRTISFVVNDGDIDSNTATKSMTITPVNDAPVGGIDSAETVPNVQLFYDLTPGAGVPATTKTVAGNGVLANDSDPEGDNISITGIVGCGDESPPFDCPTTGGGAVTLNADGTFTYRPQAGDTAADSFQYELTDDGTPAPASANVTVDLTFVGNRIWFVKNNAAAGGQGRSHDPFDTLAEAQTVAAASGDRVFVYAGDGTANNQNSGFVFGANGQTLQGEAIALTTGTTVNGGVNATLVTAGALPLIGNLGGDGVTASNRVGLTITGLSIGGSGNAIDVTTSAAAGGTYAIANNTIRGAGAEGVDINLDAGTTGTLTLDITNNAWNTAGTHTGNAIDINRAAGTLELTLSNNSNVLSTGAGGIVVAGGDAASATIRGFAGNSIHGDTAGAGVTISNVTLDASADSATQQVDGDNLAVGASGNPVGGAGLSITTSQGDLFFDDLDIFAASGTGLNLTETGTGLTFGVLPAAPDGAGTSSIDADNGAGLVATGVTLSLLLADFDSTTTGAAITLDGVGNLFRAPSGSTITKSSGAGTAVSVSNSSAPLNFTYAGTVNVTSGAGIALSNNTGSTFAFSGTLALSTGTSAALAATGGGTVTATASGSTLTTTTGTALNVANTTIGASGLTFQAISANGASNGIVLNNTGSSGSLTVTGNGGTCTSGNTAGCSGGEIKNSTGGDDSSSTPIGTGVVFNNTKSPSLTRVYIHDHSNYGIRGTEVSGFTLANSVVNGANGTNTGSPYRDASVAFTNLSGSASVANSYFSGGAADNVRIDNTNVSLDRVTFDTDTFGSNSTISGANDSLLIESEPGSGALKATISNSMFTGAAGDLLNYIHNATGLGDLVLSGNSFSNNYPTIATGGGGLTLVSDGAAGATTMSITSNTFRDAVGHAILVVKTTGSSAQSGTFSGNTIGVSGTANSGSAEGDALKLQTVGQGTMSWTVTGNQIYGYNNYGIEVEAGGGATAQSGTLNATITGNTIAEPGNTLGTIDIPKNGIHFNIGTVPGDTYQACAAIGGAGALANSIATSGEDAPTPTVGDIDFRLRQRQSTTIRLPGYGGSASDNSAVVTFVAANNGGNGAPAGLASNTVPTGGGYTGSGSTCP